MTTGSVALGPHATVAEAWAVLRALGVPQVPVVNDQQQLLGLVSDQDLSPPPPDATGDASAPRPDTLVAGLMTRKALFVDEDDDLGAVVDLMLESNVFVVPVVDPNVKVVGIVSYLDVLRNLRRAA
jgi:acetoin utilization protein AcuB